jgi:hypothetical protein
MGRKGELPYSRTVEESEKLNQAILKNEVAPVIAVEKEGEEEYYEGYEENIPAELGDNFDENYEEEEYYDDSNVESAEEAFDRSEGGYELQWPTQPSTSVVSEEASLVSKAKGMLNTLFATKEKIITFAITESELAIINENVKKAGFPGSYTMEKFNSLTKEQQEIVKKCYGR